MKNKNILIAGGSGFIGTRLEEHLTSAGYSVAILTRSPERFSTKKAFSWDTQSRSVDSEAISWADCIINLAGQGVADKRWTDQRKKILIKSRTDSVQTLVQAINQAENPVKQLIQASAIGYYGMHNEKISDESYPPGNDFLAEVCVIWEKEVRKLDQTKCNLSIARIGNVLDAKEGFMSKLLPLFNLRFPHHFGSGDQFLSWIHINDICGSIEHILKINQSEVYNLTSPNPVSFKKFSRELNFALRGKKKSFPAPAFPLRVILGELSTVVLDGVEVYPSALIKTGYGFEFPELSLALEDLVG